MAGVKRNLHTYTDVHALHKELDEVSCPVCMDHPHNAVLLLCSSHDKGCRSYICDTSYRHSNCLDRFKKLHSESSSNVPSEIPQVNLTSRSNNESENEVNVNTGDSESSRTRVDQEQSTSQRKTTLKCPLCRGTILGMKVREEVRKYLDLKIRSCSQESCSFTGNYHELRHHARRVHPKSRPSDIDPSRERAWTWLENQTEYGDIMSAIHSTTPSALVVGDYVIENEGSLMENGIGNGLNDQWWTSFVMFQMLGSLDNGSSSGRESRALRSLTWRRNRWRDGYSSNVQRRRRRRSWGRPRSRGNHPQ